MPIQDDAEQVRASFDRCCHELAFMDTFYTRFFESSPAVKTAFAGSDMDQQGVMLRASLELMLPAADNDRREALLQRLAQLHGPGEAAIPAKLYDFWLEALVQTLAVHDERFTPALERAWRRVLTAGIARIRHPL